MLQPANSKFANSVVKTLVTVKPFLLSMSQEKKKEILVRAASFAGTQTIDLVGLKKRIQVSTDRSHSYWDGYLDCI